MGSEDPGPRGPVSGTSDSRGASAPTASPGPGPGVKIQGTWRGWPPWEWTLTRSSGRAGVTPRSFPLMLPAPGALSPCRACGVHQSPEPVSQSSLQHSASHTDSSAPRGVGALPLAEQVNLPAAGWGGGCQGAPSSRSRVSRSLGGAAPTQARRPLSNCPPFTSGILQGMAQVPRTPQPGEQRMCCLFWFLVGSRCYGCRVFPKEPGSRHSPTVSAAWACPASRHPRSLGCDGAGLAPFKDAGTEFPEVWSFRVGMEPGNVPTASGASERGQGQVGREEGPPFPPKSPWEAGRYCCAHHQARGSQREGAKGGLTQCPGMVIGAHSMWGGRGMGVLGELCVSLWPVLVPRHMRPAGAQLAPVCCHPWAPIQV